MPTVTVIKPGIAPTLIFTPKIFESIRYIVNESNDEVGWLFTVDVDNNNNYVVTEIFTPKQVVSGAETDIEAQAYLDWFNILEEEGKDPAEHLYGWGHSHVNGVVNPSGQDDEQLNVYSETCPFFIRTIHNKAGDIRVDIALFQQNLLYSNCNWHVKYAELSAEEQTILSTRLDENVSCSGYNIYHKNYSKPFGAARPHNEQKLLTKLDPNKIIDDYSQKELRDMPDHLYYKLFDEYSNFGGL